MAPVAAAVLPHPPLLVPELAGAAAPELGPLRVACQEALATVAAAGLTVVIGDGPVWGVPAPAAPGSFHPYGAEVSVALPPRSSSSSPASPHPPSSPASHCPWRSPPTSWTAWTRRPVSCSPPASPGPSAPGRRGHRAGPGRHGPVRPGRDGRPVGVPDRAGPGAFHPEAARFDAQVGDAFRTGTPTSSSPSTQRSAPTSSSPAGYPSRSSPARSRGHRRATTNRRSSAGTTQLTGRRPRTSCASADGSYEDAPYGVGYLVAVLTGSER